MTAVYDYSAEEEDELSFQAGDTGCPTKDFNRILRLNERQAGLGSLVSSSKDI